MLARGRPNDAVISIFQPLLRSNHEKGETRTTEDEQYEDDED